MSTSDNLNKAKLIKNDNFFTMIDDIVEEIAQHEDYVKQFEGKIVYCNCDDPEWSAFWEFFRKFFHKLKLKKMISTHYNADGSPSYMLEWSGEKINGNTVNMIKKPLKGNGDFRSAECIELLKEADILCTNAPFSLWRDHVALIEKYHKKYIIIGSINAITYKEFFPRLRDGKAFIGYTSPKEFKQPDGTMKKFGNMCWYTNFDLNKLHEPLILTESYKGNEKKYPKYYNYDAIDVASVSIIPKDYYGEMGVPITFLDKWCMEQFDVIGMGRGGMGINVNNSAFDEMKKKNPNLRLGSVYYLDKSGKPKQPYQRIIIKRKQI